MDMREFIVLLGEILLVTLLQTVVEVFMDADKHGYQMRIINIACILGCLYLVLSYVMQNVITEIQSFVNFAF